MHDPKRFGIPKRLSSDSPFYGGDILADYYHCISAL